MGKNKGDSASRSAYPQDRSSGVKIDSALLEEVEAFINLEENKFRYVNRKQFIDIAVAEYLRKQKRN